MPPARSTDWALAGIAENSVERKEIAVKLAISAICRRFPIRVQIGPIQNQNKNRPKGTLTPQPYLPANLPENPEPE
jgi:hypothetical protein